MSWLQNDTLDYTKCKDKNCKRQVWMKCTIDKNSHESKLYEFKWLPTIIHTVYKI